MISLFVFTPEPLLQIAVSQVVLQQLPPEVALCGGVSNAADLVREVAVLQPDVVLISMSDGIGREVLRAIREQSPASKLVLWTDHLPAETAFELIESGLRGVLRRDVTPPMLLRCVCKVHEGELWFEKALTDSMLSSRKVNLSRREGDLVRLLTQGLKNKEIAASLHISEGTVKVYLSKLFAKTGAKDRLELALMGLKHLPQASLAANSTVRTSQSLFLETKSSSSAGSSTAGPSWDKWPRLVS